MPASRLDLVEVNVTDWPGSVKWYRETFDMEVSYEDAEHRWCELSFPRGGPRFALRGLDDVSRATPTPFVLSLEVDDLDGAVGEFGRRGVQLSSEVKEATRPNGQRYRWANVADPEGNGLRVFEWA